MVKGNIRNFSKLTIPPQSRIAAPNVIRRDVLTRWGGESILLRNGFVPVATTFLWHSARVGLTPVETLLVIHLISHKWSTTHPRPSYQKLAARLGISVVYCRRLLRDLERRGFLKRIPERGGNTGFDLTALFAKLARSVEERDAWVENQRPRST
jgi:hypothetical protein